jgi:hypothetical protein
MANSRRGTLAARLTICAALALGITGLVTGCGSSSPAKPAYCTDVNNFKSAANKLTDSGSPSALATNVSNVVTTGQAAISAVKTAFAPQTAALKSSLTTLATSATQLVNSSTRAAALQKIPGDVTAVKTAASNFAAAAHPKCS